LDKEYVAEQAYLSDTSIESLGELCQTRTVSKRGHVCVWMMHPLNVLFS
jgi:hypothetical protein